MATVPEILYAEENKALNKEVTAQPTTPKEDPMLKAINVIIFRYTAVYIYLLEPNWRWYDPAAEANYILDHKHADKIAKSI